MQNPSKPPVPQIPPQSAAEIAAGKTSVLQIDYKIAGLLAYLPFCAANVIFSVIWLVTEPKDNHFLRFHALQSLVLCGCYAALAVVVWLASVIMIAIPFLRFLVLLVQIPWTLITIAFVVVSIIGMIRAYKNEPFRLPYIAEIADKYV